MPVEYHTERRSGDHPAVCFETAVMDGPDGSNGPVTVNIPRSTFEYTVVRAAYMFPVNEELGYEKRIEDGYVLSHNDKIESCGQWTDAIAARVAELAGKIYIVGGKPDSNEVPKHRAILMPGFVKAHGHDHESPIIGLAKDVPLTEWLDGAVNIFTGFMNEQREMLTEKFQDSPNHVTYLKARVDDIYYGITTNMCHHCNHNKYRVQEIVQANLQAGTTMYVAVGAQDRHYDARILDTPEQAVARLDRYEQQFGNAERTTIVPGPDQFFSNGPELLKALKGWARDHDRLFHIHSSEEPNTTKWFKETYGSTPIEYADSIGVLDERTVVAHQVNNTEHDLELLKERGVKVVHNPLANTILGSGMPPVPEMLAKGIPVAISTDGSGSADFQNIICGMRTASQYFRGRDSDPKVLPAAQCLAMATAVPAKFLGLEKGQLRQGYSADWGMLDLRRPNMTPTHLENCMENMLWAADGNEVTTVMSNGVILREQGAFTTIDVDALLEKVDMLAGELMEYKKHAAEIRGTGAHK
ncbi:Atrazine chlorohydrolase [Carpediemonas membranifera]|uniref:Atrazine chlorohydrolase n=1 Tax=Carpediemonas membranifera TaxID=201153 RepID=A0A8J6ATU3_9EUKA|nr:Atrazine chlorohydrolase [Carpediemonas membranifera]|eukprot:KAG9393973.1 Atrazine chlorohydrolase [Carpediemonas membranifera]